MLVQALDDEALQFLAQAGEFAEVRRFVADLVLGEGSIVLIFEAEGGIAGGGVEESAAQGEDVCGGPCRRRGVDPFRCDERDLQRRFRVRLGECGPASGEFDGRGVDVATRFTGFVQFTQVAGEVDSKSSDCFILQRADLGHPSEQCCLAGARTSSRDSALRYPGRLR